MKPRKVYVYVRRFKVACKCGEMVAAAASGSPGDKAKINKRVRAEIAKFRRAHKRPGCRPVLEAEAQISQMLRERKGGKLTFKMYNGEDTPPPDFWKPLNQ